jgi:hypothetical protein
LANVTRRIGLSLGADACWPMCFEDIVQKLDLSIRLKGDTLRFHVQRVTIEPFSLRKPAPYDLVVDRLTHWYSTSREWIKKAILLDGVYVFNNPWSVQAMEKHTTYCAMLRLGMPIPETWLIPPKEYEDRPDLQTTLTRYAELFDLGKVGSGVGYPAFMKPYDGGGWVGVTRVDDEQQLRDAYEKSGKLVMHLQKGVVPFERFVRCIGVGPQTRVVNYDPGAPLHQRYTTDMDFLPAADVEHLSQVALTINSFFGWDFNSCETLLREGVWHPIDFANPCPDSQVTSLHVHFPWLVKAKIRWALFCAATKRKMHQNLDWEPFYAVADQDLPYPERLRRYADIAHARFDTARFEAFCKKHLAHLDEVAWEYFGTPRAREAVRLKVSALFPQHEHEQFTEYFWQKIQEWREHDAAARTPAKV